MVNLDRNESLFYEKENTPAPLLQYAVNSGNFICVTTSGIVSSDKILK
jgi:hypothetical protein